MDSIQILKNKKKLPAISLLSSVKTYSQSDQQSWIFCPMSNFTNATFLARLVISQSFYWLNCWTEEDHQLDIRLEVHSVRDKLLLLMLHSMPFKVYKDIAILRYDRGHLSSLVSYRPHWVEKFDHRSPNPIRRWTFGGCSLTKPLLFWKVEHRM